MVRAVLFALLIAACAEAHLRLARQAPSQPIGSPSGFSAQQAFVPRQFAAPQQQFQPGKHRNRFTEMYFAVSDGQFFRPQSLPEQQGIPLSFFRQQQPQFNGFAPQNNAGSAFPGQLDQSQFPQFQGPPTPFQRQFPPPPQSRAIPQNIQSLPSLFPQQEFTQHGAQPLETTSASSTTTTTTATSDASTTASQSPISAQRIAPPVDKNVDLDGDSALSLAEVQYAAFVHHGLSSSVVENLFNQVDANKDGYLSSIEFNDIRPLVLAKAENAALRYLQNVDTDRNGLLSLREAQAYILKEYGISNRDVERIWRLVVPSVNDEMDAVLFSKLRRRVRGMSIRLARQIMKTADKNEDGHIDLSEAQAIAFEQEGIGAGDVVEMLASVDDNNDGELNAPEFADFERIVRARAVDTSKKALKVVDTDGSGALTMDEAKKIAFDHYGFDEATLEPFFAQADENEDGQLDAVEFAGFRSVIRGRAVKNAQSLLPEVDRDSDGYVSQSEAEEKARREDDMDPKETSNLFNVADQDKNNKLDKVELADFVRLVRLSAIKYVKDHLKDYDTNRDRLVTAEELEGIVQDRYHLDPTVTRQFFDKVDVDRSGDLSAGEIVDFRHEIRRYVADRQALDELEEQHRREMSDIEAKMKAEQSEKAQPSQDSQTKEVHGEEKAQPMSESETKSKVPASGKTKDAEGSEEEEEEEDTEPTTTTPEPTTTATEATTADVDASTVAQKKRHRKKHRSTTVAPSEDQPEKEIVMRDEQVTSAPTAETSETTTSDDATTTTETTSTKKHRRKKGRKITVDAEVTEATVAATEQETTTPETTLATEATTVEATTESTTESTTEATTTEATTSAVTEQTDAPKAANVDKAEEEIDITVDSSTTTTAAPKKKRVKKIRRHKTTTTTTAAPEESSEEVIVEEDEEEGATSPATSTVLPSRAMRHM